MKMKFGEKEYAATLTDPVAFHEFILGNPFTLSEPQKAILRAIAQYPEVLVIAGSKSGKSSLSAEAILWGIYKLLQLPNPHKKYGLNPNVPISCMCVCPKEDQAVNIILNMIKGYAEESWYLADYVVTERQNELEFIDNIIARAQGSSSRAGRGYFIYFLVFDEFAYFVDNKGNLSGVQCVNAFMPRLLPFAPDSRFIGISTPAGRQGICYEMFRTGTPIKPYVLQEETTHGEQNFRAVFQLPTWQMNPRYPRDHPFLEKEFKRDAWFFEREYGAKFADVVSAFLNPKQIAECVEYLPLPPTEKTNNYAITHDPSVKTASYAVALGHLLADGRVRIDLVRSWDPTPEQPVSMVEVEDYIADLCKRYHVTDIIGDATRGASTIKRLESMGLPSRSYIFGAVTDIKLYQNLLELINMGGVSLPPHERLISELKFLERVTMANRYRVQASPGSTDDLADVVAMLCYVLKIEQTGGKLIF